MGKSYLTQKKGYNMYNPRSPKAVDFIDNQEVLDTLDYAEKNKTNKELINQILDKAKLLRGLNHREASVLLACEIPEVNAEIFRLAEQIKKDFYGNRIVLFAPLYLSNYCVNGCVYCPYHLKNKHMPRIKLTQEQIRQEVIALQDMGHKRLAIETGEDPVNNPIEYVLDSIKTIYSIKHKNGSIRRVNVNIAATTVENYRKLKDAGIGTYILFQETYNRESYEKLHPTGPKHDYAWHTEAMDRAMQGGIDDVGLGVLFGLESYRYEFAALLMHAEHLEACFGVGPHTISFPRIKKADDIDPKAFDNGIDDDIFAKIIACVRISTPYTGMNISTRESQSCRERVIRYGISQISGASRTSVGGYTQAQRSHDSEQFDVSDQRTLDEVVHWLLQMGYIPSFCTACYRAGRTGDRFMSLCKSRQILNCCHPNALMTLKEFLLDYASFETQMIGEKVIQEQLENITNEAVKNITMRNLAKIDSGERDFHF
jgi:2-iminoacetate synthase